MIGFGLFNYFYGFTGYGHSGQGEIYDNARRYFESDKIGAIKREHELRAQDGYKQSRYFRRTMRSTIAPRRYAGWRGGR